MQETQVFLLVEDNDNDALLLKRAFARGNLVNPLHILTTGEQALEYLKGTGPFSNRKEYPLPSVMLLDLNLPGMSGFDVLHWIRAQPELSRLRVIVLTSSESIHDVNQAYRLGANSFLIKPMDLEHLCRMTEALSGYWIWMDNAPQVSRPSLKVSLPSQQPLQLAKRGEQPG
ncbi:MAG TPA: response regulator [Verrucomicrobiae bacterium]|nr:response regulator [Verrucomicrobiae bacterium]